jgi:SET domain-containing protein
LFAVKRIYQATGIEVRRSLLHGRGVFAKKRFAKGATIERAPLIFLTALEKDWLQHTSLFHYYFLTGHADLPVAFGLGLSSLYNHRCPANAVYRISHDWAVITMEAHRSIFPDEEITLNYNGDPSDVTPVYFPPDSDL